jgi:hypothetical protein
MIKPKYKSFIFSTPIQCFLLMLMLVLCGCSTFRSQSEQKALDAFEQILLAMPIQKYENSFYLEAPDGGAVFHYYNSHATISIDAMPFLAAGLNIQSLESGMPQSAYIAESIHYDSDYHFALSSWDMLNQNVKETALEQFEANLRYIDLEETEQYFQIVITEKNNSSEMIHTATFAWTKDVASTDFDMIFSVKAEALLTAGVSPNEVEGWDYLQNDAGVWVFQKVITLQDVM